MLEIHCSGTPREVGHQHGKAARKEIIGSINFYTEYFWRKSKMDWSQATSAAEEFLPMLQRDWPDFVEEMQGIADGSEMPFSTILTLNVRTEISMGMVNDGCTTVALKTADDSFMGQNWDWETKQQGNLVALLIKRDTKPSISQIVEGGMLGKIGINSYGVGVCMNAIRVRGVDFTRLPVHCALRAVLDSTSRSEALAKLEQSKIAAAVHIMIGDPTGATSIESSSLDLLRLEMKDGRIAHSNHFLVQHAGDAKDLLFLQDSYDRMAQATCLLQDAGVVAHLASVTTLETLLEDEKGTPAAINRAGTLESPISTLFSIVMDFKTKTARVRIGRPTNMIGFLLLDPGGL